MEARIELTLKSGAQFVVCADEVKLRKLKIALVKRMELGEFDEREKVDVCGVTHEGGATRTVDLSIMTGQLAGVELTVPKAVGGEGARIPTT